MSRIICTCRVRDEEHNIERFLRTYQWADKILIADGGSIDRTIELASVYPKTEVRKYENKIYKNDLVFNPVMDMINFLLDWAENEEYPDWVIFDDADCVPNVAMQKIAREFIENCAGDFILSNRVYVYGTTQYFSEMSLQSQGWTGGIWAWRGGLGMRTDNVDTIHQTFSIKDLSNACEMKHPACRLHYFCQTEEDIQKKLSLYRTFDTPEVKHPLSYGGNLLPLLDYMEC
jgi:glycosyltransferase involved in cell wall biosynthesis